MPTKPRTKKPAAKPKRKTRTISEKPIDTLARNIADALGRRLDDLLAVKQGTAVDAWQATEKDGCTVASYASASSPQPARPVDEAIARLRSAIDAAQMVTDSTGDRLSHALSPPPPKTSGDSISANPSGGSELAACLNGLADRIYHDTRARLDILNRLEL
jgi:hypothetical protein